MEHSPTLDSVFRGGLFIIPVSQLKQRLCEDASDIHLLPAKDETLLGWWDTLLFLHALLDSGHPIRRFYVNL